MGREHVQIHYQGVLNFCGNKKQTKKNKVLFLCNKTKRQRSKRFATKDNFLAYGKVTEKR